MLYSKRRDVERRALFEWMDSAQFVLKRVLSGEENMTTHTDVVLNRWAEQLRRRGWGTAFAALLEALEPLAPAGAILLEGGRWLFTPWVDGNTLQVAALLLEDDTQRKRFLQALVTASGESLP